MKPDAPIRYECSECLAVFDLQAAPELETLEDANGVARPCCPFCGSDEARIAGDRCDSAIS